jgi:hypothetical protein
VLRSREAGVVVALVAAALGATACSRGAATYVNVAQVLSALKSGSATCSNQHRLGHARLIDAGVTCSIGGERVAVYTFRTPASRADWVKLGRLYGPFVEGPDWLVATRTPATADKVKAALGGTVHRPPR